MTVVLDMLIALLSILIQQTKAKLRRTKQTLASENAKWRKAKRENEHLRNEQARRNDVLNATNQDLIDIQDSIKAYCNKV